MDASPLVKLPPEIRNQIYELALKGHGALRITNRARPTVSETCKSRNITGLLGTCKQLRSECISMFYSINDFEFNSDAGALRPFVDMIGPQNAALLREVTFVTSGDLPLGRAGICFAEREYRPVAASLPGAAAKLRGYIEVHPVRRDVEVDLNDMAGSWVRIEDEITRELLAAQGYAHRQALGLMLPQIRMFQRVAGDAPTKPADPYIVSCCVQ